MPGNYRHIKQYEKEMMKLKEGGMTVKEIGEKFGLTYDQTHDFFKRQNRKKKQFHKLKKQLLILCRVYSVDPVFDFVVDLQLVVH